ncbi:malonyl-CoA decarboxylase domain-containing protein [Mesorhizobium sp. BHbdii]
MTLLADLLNTVFDRRVRFSSAPRRDSRLIETLTGELAAGNGDTAGVDTAREILARYDAMDDDAKLAFFRHLAVDMNIDPNAVRIALRDYEASPSGASYKAFTSAAEPPRQELIRRLNQVNGATGALVRMRADLLRLGRGEPAVEALDLDFRHLFKSWFNRGFLVLRPISWESPANILEKIIAYEAVHAISHWDDLRLRLEPEDRRCFAFFHPAMPDEPLIFVEVALARDVPDSIQALLSGTREPLLIEEANTAVFYSISNCQPGLNGISFGNSLIKQVASDLMAELPNLKTVITLSPIPGLVPWLESSGLAFDTSDADAMRRRAVDYLLTAKRTNGEPLDPVERFHLSNGAILHAVHGAADTSPKGLRESGGTMVNYLYDMRDPGKIERLQQAYADTHEVQASAAVKSPGGRGPRQLKNKDQGHAKPAL